MTRITIFGVGALGCLFGARLSPHTAVTLIGHWPEQVRALHNGPLRITGPDGQPEASIRLHVTNDPVQAAPADVALILTKSGGTSRAAQAAARILTPDGIAVTLQNGLGNLEILAEQVGEARAVQGVTTQGAATHGQPGQIAYAGGGLTHLADSAAHHDAVTALADLFTRAGLPAVVVNDVDGLVWGKLAINAAINPLTALLRIPNGALLHSEQARTLMRDAAQEVQAVAATMGITLPFDNAAAQAEAVARATATNHASMWQDVTRRAPTEIDAICGAVVRAGAQYSVPTPVNALLHRLITATEQSYAYQPQHTAE